jgi:hypothetical protein
MLLSGAAPRFRPDAITGCESRRASESALRQNKWCGGDLILEGDEEAEFITVENRTREQQMESGPATAAATPQQLLDLDALARGQRLDTS